MAVDLSRISPLPNREEEDTMMQMGFVEAKVVILGIVARATSKPRDSIERDFRVGGEHLTTILTAIRRDTGLSVKATGHVMTVGQLISGAQKAAREDAEFGIGDPVRR